MTSYGPTGCLHGNQCPFFCKIATSPYVLGVKSSNLHQKMQKLQVYIYFARSFLPKHLEKKVIHKKTVFDVKRG